jgi:hypothetical protein
LAVLILTWDCRKSPAIYQEPGASTPPDDIFLAGQQDSQGYVLLKYWQKGGVTELIQSDLVNRELSVAGIAVNGKDIYVSGNIPSPKMGYNTLRNLAVYWKNGKLNYLGDSSKQSFAKQILIAGNDIYVLGNYNTGFIGKQKQVYWKNGQEFEIQDTTTMGFSANAMAVSGNDIIIVGSVFLDSTENKTAVAVWKNGGISLLGDTSKGGYATCIAISNGDLYIGGAIGYPGNQTPPYSQLDAAYWKNGVQNNLGIIGFSTEIYSIAVSGTSVYAAGSTDYIYGRQAILWQNGSAVFLPSGSTSDSYASSVCISGGDVYVGGGSFFQTNASAGHVATYWKNGSPVYLSSGDGIAAIRGPSP